MLLISLDTQRDTPGALKATADKRGLDLTRWTLAQPQPAGAGPRSWHSLAVTSAHPHHTLRSFTRTPSRIVAGG